MSAGIMLPTSWPEPDGHITLFYLGDDTEELDRTKILTALDPLYIPEYAWRRIHAGAVEMFGENNDVPVLRVEDSWVYSLRNEIKSLLNAAGIESPSKFADDYKPHITFPLEAGITIPTVLLAGRPQLWWDSVTIDIDTNRQSNVD